MRQATESTNYRRFQTGNPVVRRLIDRFYANLLEVVEPLEIDEPARRRLRGG